MEQKLTAELLGYILEELVEQSAYLAMIAKPNAKDSVSKDKMISLAEAKEKRNLEILGVIRRAKELAPTGRPAMKQ